MSHKYIFRNPDGINFVTFAVVDWVDVFTRDIYRNVIIDNFDWYSKKQRTYNTCMGTYDKSCSHENIP